MGSAAAEVAVLRFATSELPERDRLPWLREVFGRQIVRLDIEPLRGHACELDVQLFCQLPGLRSTHIRSASPSRFNRTKEIVADGNDDLALIVNLQGYCAVSQRNQEVVLGVGEAALISHTEPATVTQGANRFRGIIMTRAALAPLVADLEDATVRRIGRETEALRLLVAYVTTLQDFAAASPELRHLAATHVDDLAALAIGCTRDGAALASGRGMRAARLRAIKDHIGANLCNHALTVTAVAVRQRVSPRYIHKLFEAEGITFSHYVLDARLARARRMLTDPRHANMTVSAIAYATGFGDLSHFNRAFRRCYGATPSEMRAEPARVRAKA
jgi:AraC-like DNA-binding protein